MGIWKYGAEPGSFGGHHKSKSDYIAVGAVGVPKAAFEADITYGQAPLMVTFSNLS